MNSGANSNVSGRGRNISPMHQAADLGNIRIVKMLTEYNARLYSQDDQGWTPLHV